MKRELYRVIASITNQLRNIDSKIEADERWLNVYEDATERLRLLIAEHMPNGSGYNNGTFLNGDKTTPNRLVFIIPYHPMDENGYYELRYVMKVTVTPDLSFGYNLRITGIPRKYVGRGDRDYHYERISNCLETMIETP